MKFASAIGSLDLDLIVLRENLHGIRVGMHKGDQAELQAQIAERESAIRVLAAAEVDLCRELAGVLNLAADATAAQVLAAAEELLRIVKFQSEEIARLTALLQP